VDSKSGILVDSPPPATYDVSIGLPKVDHSKTHPHIAEWLSDIEKATDILFTGDTQLSDNHVYQP